MALIRQAKTEELAEQLTFDLPVRNALGREDFFVSPSNAVAVGAVEGWENWPNQTMILWGPKGSGKTHLCHVWAQNTGARMIKAAALSPAGIDEFAAARFLVVEDIHQAVGKKDAETALFHLYNMMRETKASLLFSASAAPSRLNFALPDLASRLQSCALSGLDAPDDLLLSALLVKLFADRQIAVPPSLIPYVVGRMERSFAGVLDVVEALDKRALQDKRAISKVLAGQVLDKLAADKA